MRFRIPYRMFRLMSGGYNRQGSRAHKLPGYLQRTTPAQRQAIVARFDDAVRDIPRERIEERMDGITASFRQHWATYWKEYRALSTDMQTEQDVYLSDVLARFTQRRLEVVLHDAPDNIRARYLGG